MSSKVLVTGGAGFIGAHTAFELFEAGFEPVIVDNFSRSDKTLLRGLQQLIGETPIIYEGNCGDEAFMSEVFDSEPGLAGVIHFAAFKSVGESVRMPIMYYENNVVCLLNLVRAMQKAGLANLIFSSSCTVYGEPDEVPLKETTRFNRAESPYGATKQMGERILEDLAVADRNFSTIALRYFNPIGAHPSSLIGELPIGEPSNLVPYITQTAIGKRQRLVIFGGDYETPDGTCIRDFIDIQDLSKGHVLALQRMLSKNMSGNYEAFNLGTGRGVSVLQLVTKFINTTGIQVPFVIGSRREGDVVQTFADASKAEKELGWKATSTLEESLMHAWNWEKGISQQ